MQISVIKKKKDMARCVLHSNKYVQVSEEANMKVWGTRDHHIRPMQEQEICNELNDNFPKQWPHRQSDIIHTACACLSN